MIRPATMEDESAVIALWQACGLVVRQNDPVADFRLARGRKNSDVLLGLEAQSIVASVMVGHDGHRGWLYYVAVAPAHRRKGLGGQMVQAAEAWLAEQGLPKAQLMIRETNTQVAAFYRRMGYETVPRLVMQKRLES